MHYVYFSTHIFIVIHKSIYNLSQDQTINTYKTHIDQYSIFCTSLLYQGIYVKFKYFEILFSKN